MDDGDREDREKNPCFQLLRDSLAKLWNTNEYFFVFVMDYERNRSAQQQIYLNDGFVYFGSLTPSFVNDKHATLRFDFDVSKVERTCKRKKETKIF